MDAHNRDLEAQKGPWRFYRPGVEDFHHFDEEQDPDPSLQVSEKLVRLHIKVRRIRNSELSYALTL
jgi:hypothetical protein